jgi:hypothetical protein
MYVFFFFFPFWPMGLSPYLLHLIRMDWLPLAYTWGTRDWPPTSRSK